MDIFWSHYFVDYSTLIFGRILRKLGSMPHHFFLKQYLIVPGGIITPKAPPNVKQICYPLEQICGDTGNTVGGDSSKLKALKKINNDNY